MARASFKSIQIVADEAEEPHAAVTFRVDGGGDKYNLTAFDVTITLPYQDVGVGDVVDRAGFALHRIFSLLSDQTKGQASGSQ